MKKSLYIIYEFFKYVLVGGTAFIIDFSMLYISKEFLLPPLNGYELYIATTIGFICGLIYNYILSFKFVFTKSTTNNSIKAFIVFTIIGIIGLALTNLGMYIGVQILNIDYKITKILVSACVLLWNYIARKLLVFH